MDQTHETEHPEPRTVFETDLGHYALRITTDPDEPWRMYLEVRLGPANHTNAWSTLGNPRIGTMADMALAILTEYHKETKWG